MAGARARDALRRSVGAFTVTALLGAAVAVGAGLGVTVLGGLVTVGGVTTGGVTGTAVTVRVASSLKTA